MAMCQFDTPSFIYYSYPAIFLLAILTAFLILFRNTRHPVNKGAFIFIFLMALWVVDDFAQWTIHDVATNLFFAKLSVLFSSIFLFFLFFSYEFIRKPLHYFEKFIFAIPYIILVPLTFSDYGTHIYNVRTCDFIEGPLIFYSYAISVIYSFWSTRVLISKYKDLTTPHQIRSQIKVLVSAVWFACIWIVAFEEIFRISILAGRIFDISPFFMIGELFFMSLIAFAIIKLDLFNFNTVPTTIFAIFLWSAIFISIVFLQMDVLFSLIAAILYVILLLIFWKV